MYIFCFWITQNWACICELELPEEFADLGGDWNDEDEEEKKGEEDMEEENDGDVGVAGTRGDDVAFSALPFVAVVCPPVVWLLSAAAVAVVSMYNCWGRESLFLRHDFFGMKFLNISSTWSSSRRKSLTRLNMPLLFPLLLMRLELFEPRDHESWDDESFFWLFSSSLFDVFAGVDLASLVVVSSDDEEFDCVVIMDDEHNELLKPLSNEFVLNIYEINF